MRARHLRPHGLKVLTGRTIIAIGSALGPSHTPHGDVRGMVVMLAPREPCQQMSRTHLPGSSATRPGSHVHRRDVLRAFVLIISLVALLLTSSALNLVTGAQAAAASKRAVIVSGPVHSLTARYRDYARAIAAAAEARGMTVTRLLYPKATKVSVKKHANGADLFVYVGHGNGWPSPYGPYQERTKNGLGLSPIDPDQRTTSNVEYMGADWLRANIEFAPNAVVILSHLSYASGNASSGMPIPTRSVAIQRVDNFANGFLASGARVVWALGWQPGADVVNALWNEDATMDAIFRTRYRSGVNPLNGWIGSNPGYYASERVPGAEVHIDPHPSYGYLRGLTGDLSFTTNEWRDDGSVPDDTVAPVLGPLSAAQSPVTVATAVDEDLPVFTPNGDGRSDTIAVKHTLSESAFLDIEVTSNGDHVRRLSLWAVRGSGKTTWDGRRDDGNYTGDGAVRITITPRDRAGNVGESQSVRVKVLASLASPRISPPIFDPTDGDKLAAVAKFRANLSESATVSWIIRNKSGAVVRRAIDDVEMNPGDIRFDWDGTDDAGQAVPQGKYTARVRVTRPKGSYGHDLSFDLTPFKLTPSKWVLKRGASVKFTIETAEAVKWKPFVTATQPGLTKARVQVKRITAKKFVGSYTTRRAGKAGDLKIRVFSRDVRGGTQVKTFVLRLR